MMSSNTLPSSTIESLPLKVLTRIFLLATNSTTPRMPAESANASDTASQELADLPLRLSQVNQSWRYIAQHTPKLWTYIHVSHRRPHYESLLIMYLILSGHASLDITVRWLPSVSRLLLAGEEVNAQDIGAVYRKAVMDYLPTVNVQVGRLLNHVSRWRSFRLVIDNVDTMQSFIAWCSTTAAPHLTALDLRYILPPQVRILVENALHPNSDVPRFAGIQDSNISFLCLDGVRLNPPLPSLQALTTLSFNHLGVGKMLRFPELLQALRRLPSLRRLAFHSFDILDDQPLDLPPSEIVSLPALEKLSLSDVSHGWPEDFVKYTYFPNIKKLVLDIWDEGFDVFLAYLHVCYEGMLDLHDIDPETSEAQFSGSILGSLEGLQLAEFGGPSRGGVMIQDKDIFDKLINLRFLVLDVQAGLDHISNIIEYTRQSKVSHDPNYPGDASSTPMVCRPLVGTFLLLGIESGHEQQVVDLVQARKETGAPIQRLLIQRYRDTMTTDSNDPADIFTAAAVDWLEANVMEVFFFNEVELPSLEEIDDMLDVLFEVEAVVKAGEGLNFVDVFRNMLEL